MPDISQSLQQQVSEAIANKSPVNICGNKSKAFLGNPIEADTLDVSGHHGILRYEPTELVITARAGTPLTEIESCLEEQGQMLAFEPPHYGDATLGGTVACNLSGPTRPYYGAARDFVLGCKIINGKAEILQFGGEVMKNVAGYDVSRLMAGAMGTLGVLLETSLKVIPRPEMQLSLAREIDSNQAIPNMQALQQQDLPLSGLCYDGNKLYIRLAGNSKAVEAAMNKVAGTAIEDDKQLWLKFKEHQHGFFSHQKPLWRISVPANTPAMELTGKTLLDWGGAQRWLLSNEEAEKIRTLSQQAGGHATLYRSKDTKNNRFHPLDKGLLTVHKQLKTAFDPLGIFNPGRLFAEF